MSSMPSTDQYVPIKPIYVFDVPQRRIDAASAVFRSMRETMEAVIGHKEIAVSPADDAELELLKSSFDKRGMRYTIRDVPDRGILYGLSMEVVLDVFHELGLAKYIYWVTDDDVENGRFALDERITDLQYVALAAAIAAVKEGNGKQRLNEA